MHVRDKIYYGKNKQTNKQTKTEVNKEERS